MRDKQELLVQLDATHAEEAKAREAKLVGFPELKKLAKNIVAEVVPLLEGGECMCACMRVGENS